eukprot:403344494
MKVYGNYFVPEVRTVCALLELNEIPYQFDAVDIFSQDSMDYYLGFNPSQMMPCLIDGFQTILADPPHLYKFICKTKIVDEKFYPIKDMNRDKRKLIDQYLEYIQWMVKRNSDRLTKLKIEKILLEKGVADKEESMYSETEEQKEREIFFNIIVPNLESHLEGGKVYLCGYDFSIADIAFFNELINVIEIIEQNIDTKKYPNVDKWMKRIEDIGPIRVMTIKFQDELKKLTEKFRN